MKRIYPHRLDAWLSTRRSKRSELATKLGVNCVYFGHVLIGRSRSAALEGRLRALMTAEEWAFIIGESDVLTAPPVAQDAAS